MADPAGERLAEPPRQYRIARAIVRCVAPLVPSRNRDDWRREWESELWHYLAGKSTGSPPARRWGLAWRLAGAVPHAFWLRRNEWRVEMIAQDLKFAWRNTARRPAFALLVVGTLAVGIGANTAMFTVVNSVLIQPLPYPNPAELVYLNGSFAKSDRAAISPPDFLDYRDANTVFSAFAARRNGGTAVMNGTDEPERLNSSAITASYFATLGVTPFLGRSFRPEEEEPGHAEVAILSYGLWQRRFGSDPRVVGTTIVVDGQATEIIGVLPQVLDRTLDAELWRPLVFHSQYTSTRRFHMLNAVGRLKPGVSLGQAQAAMDLVARRLAVTYPENESWHLRIRPYREVIIGDTGRALVVLLGAVGLVLLIACGNVAALLLARANARQTEIAIRTALGASRTRLLRQLLTESMLYAFTGAALGLGLAAILVHGLRTAANGILPRLAEVSVNGDVLLFTTILAFGTGIAFGAAPALHAVRHNLVASFGTGTRGGSGRSSRWRDVLVGGQVALSLVLLIGAGLLLRSLYRLQHVETGFSADQVLTAEISLTGTKYADSLKVRQFWTMLAAQTRQIPGVLSASAANTLPLTGGSDTYYWIDGQSPTSEADRRNSLIDAVDDDYFITMGIPILEGRSFGPAERAGGPGAVVISRQLAHRLFPNESAIGRRLVLDFGSPFPATIIGVVGEVLAFGLDAPATPVIYYSPRQQLTGAGRINVVLRTRGDPLDIAGPLRSVIASIDRELPVTNIRTMRELVSGTVSQARFGSALLFGFAVTALLLAVIGLYGVLAYVVTQRTRELGIRLALGAPRRALFAMVIGRGMTIVVLGIIAGLVVAVAATRLLASLLFQVGSTDPAVFGLTSAALTLAGLAACIVPARRATRVDPQVALRSE